MDSHPLQTTMNCHESSSPTDSTVSLRSGTGAPIFEPGPHTRIRRNPVRAFASLTWDGGPREIFGQILNVSLTGCLLKTETTIAADTEVELTITIIGGSGHTEFDVRGKVRRTTTVRERRAYGIELLADSKHEREQIQALYSETAR